MKFKSKFTNLDEILKLHEKKKMSLFLICFGIYFLSESLQKTCWVQCLKRLCLWRTTEWARLLSPGLWICLVRSLDSTREWSEVIRVIMVTPTAWSGLKRKALTKRLYRFLCSRFLIREIVLKAMWISSSKAVVANRIPWLNARGDKDKLSSSNRTDFPIQ